MKFSNSQTKKLAKILTFAYIWRTKQSARDLRHFSQSFPTFSQGLACGSLSLHIRTKCPVRHALNRHGIFPKLVSLISQSDKATQQELDHAKAQCLDAQRAEKLLKVDFHQMEKRVS